MSDKPILIVSVWLKDGDVDAFESFETEIAKIQAEHGGRVERAIRLDNPNADPAIPFEVHVVSFDSAEGLAGYRADPKIQQLAELRQRIIAKTEVVQGKDVEAYRAPDR